MWAAPLTSAHARELEELKLGKKTQALLKEAEHLHRKLDRYAYGPPRIAFSDADLDQARAAGVLLELGRSPLICDRALYRELAKGAVARAVEDLRARVASQAQDASARRERQAARERSPLEQLEAEHRAQAREFASRAHGVNLDLGAALLDQLAVVDPADLDVARFFALGVLGPDSPNYLGTGDHAARTIAANGLRLVLGEFRTTETPMRKDGTPGKTKVAYADPEQATAWLWKFVDGAKTAGELYGRVLVVFAAEHYAFQIALPTSQRRGSMLPRSRRDQARKAFEKVAKRCLPATHGQLARAIEREAREHSRRVEEHRRRPEADDERDADAPGDAVEDGA